MDLGDKILGLMLHLQAEKPYGKFWTTKQRMILGSMVRLVFNGEPVDLVTLTDQLKKDGILESVGGVEHLVNLIENAPFLEG